MPETPRKKRKTLESHSMCDQVSGLEAVNKTNLVSGNLLINYEKEQDHGVGESNLKFWESMHEEAVERWKLFHLKSVLSQAWLRDDVKKENLVIFLQRRSLGFPNHCPISKIHPLPARRAEKCYQQPCETDVTASQESSTSGLHSVTGRNTKADDSESAILESNSKNQCHCSEFYESTSNLDLLKCHCRKNHSRLTERVCASSSLKAQKKIINLQKPFTLPGRRAFERLAEEKIIRESPMEYYSYGGISSLARSTFLMVCSDDGHYLASCHSDGSVRVFVAATGHLVYTLGQHKRTAWAAAFHPWDRERVATGCLAGEVRVWLQGELLASLQLPVRGSVCSLSFHPSQDTLAIACGPCILLWDNYTYTNTLPRVLFTMADREMVRYVNFSPCGKYLLTAIRNPPELDEAYAVERQPGLNPLLCKTCDFTGSDYNSQLYSGEDSYAEILNRCDGKCSKRQQLGLKPSREISVTKQDLPELRGYVGGEASSCLIHFVTLLKREYGVERKRHINKSGTVESRCTVCTGQNIDGKKEVECMESAGKPLFNFIKPQGRSTSQGHSARVFGTSAGSDVGGIRAVKDGINASAGHTDKEIDLLRSVSLGCTVVPDEPCNPPAGVARRSIIQIDSQHCRLPHLMYPLNPFRSHVWSSRVKDVAGKVMHRMSLSVILQVARKIKKARLSSKSSTKIGSHFLELQEPPDHFEYLARRLINSAVNDEVTEQQLLQVRASGAWPSAVVGVSGEVVSEGWLANTLINASLRGSCYERVEWVGNRNRSLTAEGVIKKSNAREGNTAADDILKSQEDVSMFFEPSYMSLGMYKANLVLLLHDQWLRFATRYNNLDEFRRFRFSNTKEGIHSSDLIKNLGVALRTGNDLDSLLWTMYDTKRLASELPHAFLWSCIPELAPRIRLQMFLLQSLEFTIDAQRSNFHWASSTSPRLSTGGRHRIARLLRQANFQTEKVEVPPKRIITTTGDGAAAVNPSDYQCVALLPEESKEEVLLVESNFVNIESISKAVKIDRLNEVAVEEEMEVSNANEYFSQSTTESGTSGKVPRELSSFSPLEDESIETRAAMEIETTTDVKQTKEEPSTVDVEIMDRNAMVFVNNDVTEHFFPNTGSVTCSDGYSSEVAGSSDTCLPSSSLPCSTNRIELCQKAKFKNDKAMKQILSGIFKQEPSFVFNLFAASYFGIQTVDDDAVPSTEQSRKDAKIISMLEFLHFDIYLQLKEYHLSSEKKKAEVLNLCTESISSCLGDCTCGQLCGLKFDTVEQYRKGSLQMTTEVDSPGASYYSDLVLAIASKDYHTDGKPVSLGEARILAQQVYEFQRQLFHALTYRSFLAVTCKDPLSVFSWLSSNPDKKCYFNNTQRALWMPKYPYFPALPQLAPCQPELCIFDSTTESDNDIVPFGAITEVVCGTSNLLHTIHSINDYLKAMHNVNTFNSDLFPIDQIDAFINIVEHFYHSYEYVRLLQEYVTVTSAVKEMTENCLVRVQQCLNDVAHHLLVVRAMCIDRCNSELTDSSEQRTFFEHQYSLKLLPRLQPALKSIVQLKKTTTANKFDGSCQNASLGDPGIAKTPEEFLSSKTNVNSPSSSTLFLRETKPELLRWKIPEDVEVSNIPPLLVFGNDTCESEDTRKRFIHDMLNLWSANPKLIGEVADNANDIRHWFNLATLLKRGFNEYFKGRLDEPDATLKRADDQLFFCATAFGIWQKITDLSCSPSVNKILLEIHTSRLGSAMVQHRFKHLEVYVSTLGALEKTLESHGFTCLERMDRLASLDCQVKDVEKTVKKFNSGRAFKPCARRLPLLFRDAAAAHDNWRTTDAVIHRTWRPSERLRDPWLHGGRDCSGCERPVVSDESILHTLMHIKVANTSRIQLWPYSSSHLPDIANRTSHLVVCQARVQCDTSVAITRDWSRVAVFLPRMRADQDSCMLGVFPLHTGSSLPRPPLYTGVVDGCSVSLSFTPSEGHLVVGCTGPNTSKKESRVPMLQYLDLTPGGELTILRELPWYYEKLADRHDVVMTRHPDTWRSNVGFSINGAVCLPHSQRCTVALATNTGSVVLVQFK